MHYYLKKDLAKYLDNIEEVDEKSIQPYDEVILEGRQKIMGRRTKEFVIMDSDFFRELINEISTNSKCKYVTPYNDLIKSGYTPKYFSVLKKNVDMLGDGNILSYEYAVREQCAMYFLEYMGLETSYQKLGSLNDNPYTFSLDFIGKGEEFFTFAECGFFFFEPEHLQYFKEIVTIEHDRMILYGENKISREAFEKILDDLIEELVYSYLVRTELLADGDNGNTNQGLIVNKEIGTIKLSPQYDYELCFCDNRNRLDSLKNKSFNKFKMVKENYPNVYKRFVKNFLSLITPQEKHSLAPAQQIIKEVVGDDYEEIENIILGSFVRSVSDIKGCLIQLENGMDSYDKNYDYEKNKVKGGMKL